jgi:hypothetical protein
VRFEDWNFQVQLHQNIVVHFWVFSWCNAMWRLDYLEIVWVGLGYLLQWVSWTLDHETMSKLDLDIQKHLHKKEDNIILYIYTGRGATIETCYGTSNIWLRASHQISPGETHIRASLILR